jgi:hypothetical protein
MHTQTHYADFLSLFIAVSFLYTINIPKKLYERKEKTNMTLFAIGLKR